MAPGRQLHSGVLTFVGALVVAGLACSDSSATPSIHGAGPGVIGSATQIDITPSSAALNQGGRAVLRCAAFDVQGVMLPNQPVWTSSDANVATVTSDGYVTAQRPGSTSVTCQIGGRSATSTITVSTARIAFVEVSPGAGTLPTGGSLQLVGVPRDSLGFQVPGSDVQWSSADTSIATVSPSGVVKAKVSGDADIRAVSGGVAGMTKIKVSPTPPPPVASVSVSVDQTSLSAGSLAHATATTTDANGQVLTGRAITWSATNPAVLSAVTTSATKANVRALAQGASSLVATSEGVSASVSITVGAPAVAIVVTSLASSSIIIGQTTLASAVPEDGLGNPLTGHAVTWASLDPSIATVSSTGVVTGVSAGTVIIRATSDGVTGDASLTVTAPAVASVSTTLGSSSLITGQTTQATVVARDASGTTLTGRYVAWSSLNPSIATVSITGLVTAVAPGTAIIRATVESKTGDATLAVSAPQLAAPTAPSPGPTATVLVTIDSASLQAGHTAHATAVAKDASGTVLSGKTPTWASQNTAIATVDATTGVVTGVSAGTTRIQAKIDTIIGSAPLTVTVPSVITSPVPAGTGSHPNQPAGFTQLLAQPFDTPDNTDFAYNPTDVYSIVSDPSNPGSSQNVGQVIYPAGFPSGGAPITMYPRHAFSKDSIYVSFWVKVSSNWYGNASSVNKIMFWDMLGSPENLGAMEFGGVGTDTGGPYLVAEGIAGFVQGPDNSYGAPPTVILSPNQLPQPWVQFTKGVWHRYEAVFINNTPGHNDGTIRFWLDGVLAGDWTNRIGFQTTGLHFSEIVWSPTYGGGGPAVPANQWMWLKDLYVSGK